jgi:hypothetical protein
MKFTRSSDKDILFSEDISHHMMVGRRMIPGVLKS